MNRLLSCTVVLAASLGAFSCGDPTADLRTGPAHLTADPTSVVMTKGVTKAIVVRVLDDQGNELADSVAVTFPASLVSVRVDSTFLVSTDTTTPTPQIPSSGRTRTKFLVTGVGSDSGTVVFTSGDLSLNVPVRVIPDTLAATISPQSAQPGDIVTITAAPKTVFDDTVHVLFGPAEAFVVSRAPDGSSLQIQPAPGSTGHATIQGVKLLFAESSDTTPLSFSFATTDTVFVPPVTDIPAVFSATNPAVNQTVTMTAAGFKFIPDSVGISFETGGPALILGVSADSNTVSFRGTPGSTGIITVTNAALSVVPVFPLTLTATSTITVSSTVPSLAPANATTASAPTVTIPDGFFDAGSFTGADITQDAGLGAQYYKFTLAADADVTISIDAQAPAPDTDLDLLVCADVTCSDGGDISAALPGSSAETGTFSLVAGTYYVAVVLFAGGAPGSISLLVK